MANEGYTMWQRSMVGIFNSDGKVWSELRKVASHMFSASVLRNQMNKVFTEHGQVFCDLLAERAATQSDEYTDLQNLFFRFTLDSICEVAFSKRLDSLHKDVPFGSAFDRSQEIVFTRMVVPNFACKFMNFFSFGFEGEFKHCMRVVDGFVYQTIEERSAQKARAEPFSATDFGDLIDLFEFKRGDKLEKTQLRDLIVGFLVAGRDTTACALSWMFWRLCNHRDVEAKLLAEFDEVLGAEEPHADNVKNLEYLDAVICETLRLHPSVPGETKYCAVTTTFPDGNTVPAGTIVNYPPYVMGRLESLWGKDAAEFKPERWIEIARAAGKPVKQAVSQYQFVQFNAGPRLCLGKEMAFLEAKMVTVMLLRRFRFEVKPGHDASARTAIIMPMKHGLPVKITPRA